MEAGLSTAAKATDNAPDPKGTAPPPDPTTGQRQGWKDRVEGVTGVVDRVEGRGRSPEGAFSERQAKRSTG